MKKSTPKSKPTVEKSALAKPEPPRLVLDTNVLVSALLWTGSPHELLRAARTRAAVLLTSPALIEELRGVLARPKLAPRIAELGTSVDELMNSVLRRLLVIEQVAVAAVIPADPDDDRVLACALAGNARYIVSGDRHLLDLENYKGIAILRPAAMLAKLPPRSAKP